MLLTTQTTHAGVSLQVVPDLFPTQFPANAPRKVRDDGPNTGSHATIVGETDSIPDSGLQLRPILNVVVILGMNRQMEALFSCLFNNQKNMTAAVAWEVNQKTGKD